MKCFAIRNRHSLPAAAALVLVLAVLIAAAVLPAAALRAGENDEGTDDFVVVKAGRIITITGEEIEKGTIVIKNGVIEAVGKNVEIPFPARVIEAGDLTVMPGLIDPCTQAGLRLFRRSGVHADLKVADEFDPDARTLADILLSGFTTLGFCPSGTGFPGQALAARPVAKDCPSRVLNESAYVFAEFDTPSRDKKALKSAFETAKKEIEKQEKALKDWEEKQKKEKAAAAKKAEDAAKKGEDAAKKGEDAAKKGEDAAKKGEDAGKKAEDAAKKAEAEKKEPEKKNGGESGKNGEKKEPEKFKAPPINPPYVPLVDLIQKKEGVKALVAFGQAGDYVHFVDAVKDFEFARMFFLRNAAGYSGDSDLMLVADKLGEAQAEVALYPAINFKPLTRNRFNLAAELVAAGCKVSLVPTDASLSAHADHLRRVAALVRGGLDREDALKAVTLRPAELLGIADRVGSVEKGRDADLLFLTGDPFDPLTRVDRVMIRGNVMEGSHEIQ